MKKKFFQKSLFQGIYHLDWVTIEYHGWEDNHKSGSQLEKKVVVAPVPGRVLKI